MWVWYKIASFPGTCSPCKGLLIAGRATKYKGLIKVSFCKVTRIGCHWLSCSTTHGDVPCKVSTTNKQTITQQQCYTQVEVNEIVWLLKQVLPVETE